MKPWFGDWGVTRVIPVPNKVARLSSQTTDPKTEICPVCYLFGLHRVEIKIQSADSSATSDEVVQTRTYSKE